MCLCVIYKGTSHCADMYANTRNDPSALVAARARIGHLVDKWIDEAYYRKNKHIYEIIFIEHIGF